MAKIGREEEKGGVFRGERVARREEEKGREGEERKRRGGERDGQGKEGGMARRDKDNIGNSGKGSEERGREGVVKREEEIGW